MGKRSPGLLREESRGPLQDLHIATQPPVLPPQRRQLLALRAGQPAVATRSGVSFGLAHPRSHRGLGQIEVPGDLPDRAVTALAQLHDLGLELGRERPAHTRLAAFHDLHDGHPPRSRTPDRRCPSNRVRPSAARVAYNWGLKLVVARLQQRRAGEDVEVPWTLPALRREWNRAKDQVAPWWA